MSTLVNDLKEKWEALKAENPHMRIRNAAAQLGVSEAELLATNIGEGVTVLKPEFQSILTDVEQLGKVMALTRNDECVHERKGIYQNPDFSSPHAQLFVGEDIDLRIFLTHWKLAFAVVEGDKKSLQFFGKDGLALHKIYLTKDSFEDAFYTIVGKYKADDQNLTFEFEEIAAKATEKSDDEIDVEGFQKAWKELKDTHDFFMMTRKYGVSRTQALRLAPEGFAKKIDNARVVNVLEDASEKNLPIMIFVGNRGIIQIHTGLVKKTLWHQQWFNVMDPDFNLHLDVTKIAEAWIVKKPTEDGEVTAIEVFNKQGDFIVQFFGKRKPGIPELQEWKDLVADLEK
ncbi:MULTISPECIES: hemin-degrading factor [Chryseobacterium]|uniref:Hemin transport protein n=1 Tax=Chryseobacterium camelliae TaxID=1265445 RepID=A0ABU0THK4_9FLAO|nr:MULTISPECIES: ChuX/HutX family heme-like substrate-binding protein [Chryseobacterium]MDT3409601.1 putative hemin transport protein [Pseudacidovorax intermedius]MDQ1096539.1 putative hemin transport protein [Chryseobacterium camelliae]MDQ1100480.1 putative hemin transport protein [Chryseobacterium sp. SORGH_AS_1048]MDR6087820.1 putative hemin transport protein [Chryseobacterium sp. SORGH_AS_0909]MDR6132195.1 putative hemin transport protein [Chryseobacterium sp. SORGH_AS_1175]